MTQSNRPGQLHRVGWLLVLLTLATALLPQPSTSATETICVALVVDLSPLGGDVDSGCTRVPSGATGYDVLKAGGHTYTVCSNGVIGEIDQQPDNGCQIKDNNHFWGYWHRKPGSTTWTFSSYGAGFYHPGEGSTDGWVWEDGSTTPPADVPYPAGCHSPPRSASPTPAATHQPASAPTSTSAPRTTTVAGGRGSGSLRKATASPSMASTAQRAQRSRAPSPTATATTTTTPSVDEATGATTRTLDGKDPTESSGSGGHIAPVLVGLAAAALLGGAAWWRLRRASPS